MAPSDSESAFVSRAGLKLAHALEAFGVRPQGLTCADLGCSTGGFTDCLLQHGAARVYAVDRGFGVLDYRLRTDPRVVVMERTDALHACLPEPVSLVTIDCGWTRQSLILPAARKLFPPFPMGEGRGEGQAQGHIITLVKPHYESEPGQLKAGVLPDELCEMVVSPIRPMLASLGLRLLAETESPIRGRGGNREFLWHLGVDNNE